MPNFFQYLLVNNLNFIKKSVVFYTKSKYKFFKLGFCDFIKLHFKF